jgi:hypothetical protein
MRWLRRRHKPPSQAEHQRAEEAVRLTEQQAAEAKRRLAEDRALAARFKELREKNHFAEGFARALREGH